MNVVLGISIAIKYFAKKVLSRFGAHKDANSWQLYFASYYANKTSFHPSMDDIRLDRKFDKKEIYCQINKHLVMNNSHCFS